MECEEELLKRGAKEVNKAFKAENCTEGAMKEKRALKKGKLAYNRSQRKENASVLSSRRTKTKRFNRACANRE